MAVDLLDDHHRSRGDQCRADGVHHGDSGQPLVRHEDVDLHWLPVALFLPTGESRALIHLVEGVADVRLAGDHYGGHSGCPRGD